ncbi:tRNA (cytidine(34)-2'-O)-methyltransferase [Halobacteriovorax sp. HLS]|uniref:tRNA (cytidine(34)-2'-O)-methyltransferase n=1 Tax=Halobacteriovorax sp. HLS TaxID=2234000 RepID=UPI000FDA6D0E|nr:tRNA (cytidine(34)-2'-O)-methyltransferase [Halobacteriovorax sp. HLS]
MKKTNFKIVLVCPEIPGNTGSIGRTCLALNAQLILIHPLGFDIDEKAVRRAGLDYWKDITLTEYMSFEEFIKTEKPSQDKLHFFTKKSQKNIFETEIKSDCYLIFGAESTGLSEELLEEYDERSVAFPILNENIRSLNLASIVTAAGFEAIRQIKYK